MISISIIVPIYNTPISMFEKCVNSLIEQTSKNVEIILVDDGSSSGIESECDKYSDKYSNVITVDKKNGGLAAARNTGVKLSNGEWVMFLDSDDWIEKETCEELEACVALNDNVDFITFGYVHDFGNRIVKCSFDFDNNTVLLEKDKNLLFINSLKLPSLYSSSCWKLFNKKFLEHNLLFHDETIRQGSEDLEFMLRVINCVGKTVCLNKRYYHYVMNINSITNSFNEQNAYLVQECFRKMESTIICQDSYIVNKYYIRAWYAICSSLVSGFMNPNNGLKYSQKKFKAKEYVNTVYCKTIIRNIHQSEMDFSRRLVLVLVKNNMWLFVYIIAILRGKQKNR